MDDDLARFVAIRRDLHTHPELAFEEHRTSALVADALENLGIEVHRGLAGTGVVGVLKNGHGTRSVGLRADMDALPLGEENTFGHRSRHTGKMHACGHDGHTAMLLAAAARLAATRRFNGTVVFIFQPAEEGEGGARVMIEQGLFERFPMDGVFGLHNWPGLAAGCFSVTVGPVMASTDTFEIALEGRGAHAAMPHQGIDPVLAGAALVQALQGIVTRNRDPLDAAVLSVTRFHAGEAYNIIPDRAVIGGTVRALTDDVQHMMEAAIRRVAAGVAAAHGVTAEVNYRRGYPATVNDRDAAALCVDVAGDIAGPGRVRTDLRPSMGAEDFAYLLRHKPGCYVWLGNGEAAGGCMLHSPRYDFNDEILPVGAAYWVALAERFLSAED